MPRKASAFEDLDVDFDRVKKLASINPLRTPGSNTRHLLAWFDDLSSVDNSKPLLLMNNKKVDTRPKAQHSRINSKSSRVRVR